VCRAITGFHHFELSALSTRNRTAKKRSALRDAAVVPREFVGEIEEGRFEREEFASKSRLPDPIFGNAASREEAAQSNFDKGREKTALEPGRDCVIAKMNTDLRGESMFFQMRVAVYGSQCGLAGGQ
jgi:hypothetical protein